MIRLMVQKSGIHQLSLGEYLHCFHETLYIPGGDPRISEPSTVSSWRILAWICYLKVDFLLYNASLMFCLFARDLMWRLVLTCSNWISIEVKKSHKGFWNDKDPCMVCLHLHLPWKSTKCRYIPYMDPMDKNQMTPLTRVEKRRRMIPHHSSPFL